MTDALDRQADALRAPAAQPAPWVAIAGAKGGVGKTMLAVNLALLLARHGQRTLLVDLDPGCGDVPVQLRLHAACTLDDLVAGACAPAAALLDGPAGLRVLAGCSGSEQLAGADAGLRARVFAAVAQCARGFDVVVCDTGAGIGPMVVEVAERAGLLLAVTTPDPASVTDTYALCKVLHARGRPLPRLCVNGSKSRDEAMRTAGRLASVCARFLGTDCPFAGWIRRDDAIERSTHEQRPLALHGHGPAVDDLQALCAVVRSLLPALPRRAAPAPVRPLLRQGQLRAPPAGRP